MEYMEYHLKTLSPIWTGDAFTKNEKVQLTGIKGSLRWWSEAVIRGLGLPACDPVTDDRCELKSDYIKALKKEGLLLSEYLDTFICPACKIYGCTNWGSKFKLQITTPEGEPLPNGLNHRGTQFLLKFVFLKPITDYEKAILDTTVNLIVKYGALGGKTVLKPSNLDLKNSEKYRKNSHLDYGILDFDETHRPYNFMEKINEIKSNTSLLHNPVENNPDFPESYKTIAYPDLRYFWFAPGLMLNFNQINNLQDNFTFIKGRIGDSSKKLFSFHGKTFDHYDWTGGERREILWQCFTPRSFGYLDNAHFNDFITNHLNSVLNRLRYTNLIKGLDVLDVL
jgi:CRISPR-associated protein Cmr1